MDEIVIVCIVLYLIFCVIGYFKVDSDGDIRSWSGWAILDGLGFHLSLFGYLGFPGIILHKIIIKRKKKKTEELEKTEEVEK